MHPSPEPTSSFRLYAALICIKSARHRAERRTRDAAEPSAEARRALVAATREISTRSLLHETRPVRRGSFLNLALLRIDLNGIIGSISGGENALIQ